jgi:hypothetical protein
MGKLFPLERESSQISGKEKKNPKNIVGKEKTVVIVIVFKCQKLQKTSIMILLCVKKIQCNELSFSFSVLNFQHNTLRRLEKQKLKLTPQTSQD